MGPNLGVEVAPSTLENISEVLRLVVSRAGRVIEPLLHGNTEAYSRIVTHSGTHTSSRRLVNHS